ncbi:MAG: hypothetical protein HY366_01760 [Candidatus Aenigmarchaeota archaeon]|nr:hypothetical protein [Candidatus Aenigmarchaeota archaeon]
MAKHKDTLVMEFNPREYAVPILLALLLVVSLFQMYQINALESKLSPDNGVDMSGWTAEEKMMYEHHGTLPARLEGQNSNGGGGMVGGC